MDSSTQDPGRRLRELRERLGMKYRDVQEATAKIAGARGRQDFALGLSRLADIENRGVVPSIYRLYSLAAVYGRSIYTLLQWYGVDPKKLPVDTARVSHRRTRAVEKEPAERPGEAGSRLPETRRRGDSHPVDSSVPHALTQLEPNKRYAVVGSDDWGMYPIIYPGAYVQIDDKRTKPESGPWANEHDRPIYVIEDRNGDRCAWCQQRGRELTLEFHPSSGVVPVTLLTPDEGEVVGQVIGIAMRLDPVRRRRIRF